MGENSRSIDQRLREAVESAPPDHRTLPVAMLELVKIIRDTLKLR